MTCAQAGMDFLGDDYLLLNAGSTPPAHALYSTARVDRRSLAGLAEVAGRVGDPGHGEEKVLLDLKALYPECLCNSLAVEAVVIPRFDTGAETTLKPINAAAALRGLAPSTIFQAPDGGAPALAAIADVVRSVPAVELRMGSDLRDVPERIGSLLAAGA